MEQTHPPSNEEKATTPAQRPTPHSLPKLIIPEYTAPPPEEITPSHIVEILDATPSFDRWRRKSISKRRTSTVRRDDRDHPPPPYPCSSPSPPPLPPRNGNAAATTISKIFRAEKARRASEAFEEWKKFEGEVIPFPSKPSRIKIVEGIRGLKVSGWDDDDDDDEESEDSSYYYYYDEDDDNDSEILDSMDFTARDRREQVRAWKVKERVAKEHDALRKRYYGGGDGDDDDEEEAASTSGSCSSSSPSDTDKVENSDGGRDGEKEQKRKSRSNNRESSETLAAIRAQMDECTRQREEAVERSDAAVRRRRVRREFRQDFNPIWREVDGWGERNKR